jgi:ATP-binding cassette, subfamily B, heavy metal transporter
MSGHGHGRGRGDGRRGLRLNASTPLLGGESASSTPPSWPDILRVCTPYMLPKGRRNVVFAAISMFALFLGKVLALVPPLAIKYAVDIISDNAATSAEKAKAPVVAVLMFFGSRMLLACVGAVENVTHKYVSSDARRRFSVDLYAALCNLSLGYHQTRRSGEILRVMNRGATSITVLMNVFLFTLVPTAFETALIAAVFMKIGEGGIALAVLCSVAIYFWFTLAVTSWRTAFRRRMIDADNAVSDASFETLTGIEVVKTFATDMREVERFDTKAKAYADASNATVTSLELLNLGQGFIRQAGLAAGLTMAAIGTVRSTARLSAGSFVQINMYIDQLYRPLAWLGSTWRQVTSALTDLELAQKVLTEIPTLVDAPDAIDLPEGVGSVSFENVSFSYPAATQLGREESKRAGVNRVSFSLKPGQMLGIAGASGSCKTTLARLLLRLYDVDSGAVIVNGYDVRKVTQKSLRHSIGTVPQDPALFNESLRYNIAFGCVDFEPTDAEIFAAARAAALGDFIDCLPDKLDTIVGERGVRLSGGERARVGIARALVKKPALLLMDEPSSSVDVLTEKKMQENIAELCKGRSTVVIAHRLSTIKDADEILVMSNGAVIERGRHSDLIERNSAYKEMWSIQTRFDAPNEDKAFPDAR